MSFQINFDYYVILIQLFSFILYSFEEKTNYSLEIFKKIFSLFIPFNLYAKNFLQIYLILNFY